MNPNEAAKRIGTELGQSNPKGDARLAVALAQPSEIVKRYCYSVVRDVYGIKSAEMVEDANGAYVLHSDYAALAKAKGGK